MNPTLRKIVLKSGRQLIKQLQKLMGRYSLVGGPNFFSPEQFPRIAGLEANFPVIREEHWKTFLFFACGTDTIQHEAWADSDQTRVVLFMDVVHPLPFPISLLNSLVIKSIAASPFIRDAKKKSRRPGAPNERLMELNRGGFSARLTSSMNSTLVGPIPN